MNVCVVSGHLRMLIGDFFWHSYVQGGVCLVAFSLLGGCAGEVPVPTRMTSFRNEYTFSRSFDQMWDIAHRMANTYHAVVNASDRNSGLLTFSFSFSGQSASRHVTLWLTPSGPDKTIMRVRALLSNGSELLPSDGTIEEGILRDFQRASQEFQ